MTAVPGPDHPEAGGPAAGRPGADRPGVDLGLTHVALPVRDLEASISFYERYADMRVVHRRVDPDAGVGVAWLSDLTRPFVVVLLEAPVRERLGGSAHLGVACASRDEVDRRCARARAEGLLVDGPSDSGPPVGYWAIVADPDGHNLELAHGQEVAFAVDAARATAGGEPPRR